jgi:ankyrin repeat protein
MTPLHLAATQGQKATVIALLNLGADPDAEGKEKWPPILWAAHKGNTEVVEVLCTAQGQTKRHMQQVRESSFQPKRTLHLPPSRRLHSCPAFYF